MTEHRSFDPDLLRFLSELKTHNNKAWFEGNRARYESVYKAAFAGFVDAFGPRLERISPYLVADPRPVGGSVMRIFRDTRFSKDKSPYRSYTVVHFMHRDAGKEGGPGLFLYVSPEEISGGGGWWHPEPAALRGIRAAIVKDPDGWRAATTSPAFRKRFELSGEPLKRAPPGFDPEHPLVEDLRRKDFVASTDIDRRTFTSPKFADTYEGIGRTVRPLLSFLCDAARLDF